MKFKKTPQALFDLLSDLLGGRPCHMRKMFGGVGYFVNGAMFAGAHQDDIFLRLPPSDREAIRQQSDEVHQFEPMPGRAMSEYVAFAEGALGNEELRVWLERASAYASGLPRKEKKGRGKKA